jgi:hypothetical protein
MALLHLRLKEPTKLPIYGPPYAVALNHTALQESFLLEHTMDVYPDALPQNFDCNSVCVFVS